MTATTSEKLARDLEAAGLAELAKLAREDMFHDFLSPYDLPELELEAQLRVLRDACPDHKRRVLIEQIRQGVMQGVYDASKEESDAWAASPEGREAYEALFEAVHQIERPGVDEA